MYRENIWDVIQRTFALSMFLDTGTPSPRRPNRRWDDFSARRRECRPELSCRVENERR